METIQELQADLNVVDRRLWCLIGKRRHLEVIKYFDYTERLKDKIEELKNAKT